MKLSLTVLVAAAVAFAHNGPVSAAPFTDLRPYNTNSSLEHVRQSTMDKIEELVEEELLYTSYRAYHGFSPDCPASSCKELAQLRPDYSSGYYWVTGDAGPTGVYCEMAGEDIFGESGGWMRIAHVDMNDGRTVCPRGLEYTTIEGKGLCQRPRDQVPGCSSTTFAVQHIQYSKLCGKVVGYYYRAPNGFGPSKYTSNKINDVYIDGVSITHGSPRQHIWSLAAARSETYHLGGDHTACPCMDYSRTFTGEIPSYVGDDYYCETGNRGDVEAKYYFDDPLWDGQGCEGTNQCCERGGPWFCTELDGLSTDDIEMRVCGNSKADVEDVVLQQVELYIQ